MREVRTFVLIGTGVLLLFGGFIYDILFAGIPYQDPTPEMSARYACHSHIASVMCWSGAGVFLVGVLVLFVRKRNLPDR